MQILKALKQCLLTRNGGAYKILELEKSATDQQVKKSYRDLAKKHHPDKVQHLGRSLCKGSSREISTNSKSISKN